MFRVWGFDQGFGDFAQSPRSFYILISYFNNDLKTFPLLKATAEKTRKKTARNCKNWFISTIFLFFDIYKLYIFISTFTLFSFSKSPKENYSYSSTNNLSYSSS